MELEKGRGRAKVIEESRIERILRERSALIDGAIKEMISFSSQLQEPMMHLIKAGGKRIRPAITLLSCEACGGDPRYAIAPAVSVELVHTASLIHDDIIDSNVTRRGVPSVHVEWGLPTGVLAGDCLLALAVRSLILPSAEMKVGDLHFVYTSEEILENIDRFARAWTILCDGKKMDSTGDVYPLTETYVMDLIYRKTGVLFELAAEMGAIYAGASSEQRKCMASYGKNVGMAFQIRDDVLGVVGSEEITGKHVGVDIREGKKTLLILHALQNSAEHERRKILRIVGNRNAAREEIMDVVEIIRSTGAVEYAMNHARTFVERAKGMLQSIPQSDARSYLIELADYAIQRIK